MWPLWNDDNAILLTFGSIVIVLGLVGTIVVTLSRRHAHRWGLRRGPSHHLPDGGAYRAATVTPLVPRGTPRVASWAAGLSFLWALPTLLFFAPLGLLLALITADSSWLGAASVALVSLDGFVLAIGLVVAGIALLRARGDAVRITRGVAGWSIAHHAAVMLVFLCWCVVPEGREAGLWLAAVSAIPCLLGAVGGSLLLVASSEAARILAPEDVARSDPHLSAGPVSARVVDELESHEDVEMGGALGARASCDAVDAAFLFGASSPAPSATLDTIEAAALRSGEAT